MRRGRSPHRRHRLLPGFNLVPMLDMVFNLLFFFVLTTDIRRQGAQMNVHLPQSATAARVMKEQPTPAVTIDAGGQVFFKDRPMVREELDMELHYLADKGESQIDIRADQQANYGRVIEVMDWCKLAGIKSVMLKLQRPPDKK